MLKKICFFCRGGGGGGGDVLGHGDQSMIFLFVWFTQFTCLRERKRVGDKLKKETQGSVCVAVTTVMVTVGSVAATRTAMGTGATDVLTRVTRGWSTKTHA